MLHDQGSIDTAKHLGLLEKEVVVRKSKGKAVKKTVVVKIAGRMEDIQLCYELSFQWCKNNLMFFSGLKSLVCFVE